MLNLARFQKLLIALLLSPTLSGGRESVPSQLCALLSPTAASADLPCGGSSAIDTSSEFEVQSNDLRGARGDACGRALLEALLLLPIVVASTAESSWSCFNTQALLVAVDRFPELDSALWRGALSDAALALQERCAEADTTSSSRVSCAQCSFVHQVLSSQANHHSEKGPYLARALDAAEAFDDAVLFLKSVRSYGRIGSLNNNSGAERGMEWLQNDLTKSPAAMVWADKWAGTEWSARGAAAKNYAFFLEHRDLPLEADAVLARAIARTNSTSHEDELISSRSEVMSPSPQVSGLALQRAMICPPHFGSQAAAADIHRSLISKLDDFLAEAKATRPHRHHQRRSANNGITAEDLWFLDVGFPASPLRLLGALPLAWPYLGYPMRPLHERLCFGLRLLVGLSLTTVAPHLKPLLPPSSPPPASPSASALPEGKDELFEQQQHQRVPAIEAKKRRVRVGVFGEGRGNTSPGVLAGGWLARLPVEDFELVWFEPEHLNTVFAAIMRARADVTVVLSERPTRILGSFQSGQASSGNRDDFRHFKDDVDSSRSVEALSAADPLMVARVAVAAQRCDVLVYLALGITPMTFFLAQVRVK